MTTKKSEKVEYANWWCKYSFSEEEKRDIAETLAQKTQELSEVDQERKSVMSSYKERIDRITSEQSQSARLYKDGYEMRDIECIVERDIVVGEVRYIRTDTGEVAHRKKMTMAERQMNIDQAPKKIEEKTDEEIQHDIDVSKTNRIMAGESSSV